jgi:NDP-sugar pyrophosphorylase family protein
MTTNGRLVILAGGISSRMKRSVAPEFSADQALIRDADSKAKSMIGVGRNQRPFLDYLLYNARQTGYRDVLIVIGEGDDSIRSYYGHKDEDNDFSGLKISYAIQQIPEGRQKPMGTADALYQGLKGKSEWSGKRFTVCNSDNLYSEKALGLMREHKYRSAMVDYDRHALQFEWSRIERFAVTLKDGDGFLTGIIEKPSEAQIQAATGKDGFVGVSMNIFDLQYDMIFPFLEKVPFHPLRNEKELPEAVTMMVGTYPQCCFAYPLSEHVLDLTEKGDILPVKKYLETYFENATF